MKTLKKIAAETGARKIDVVEKHYIELYEKYFYDRRNMELDLLEIGIDKGGSLKMWLQYFQYANIYGIDISDKSHLGWPNDPRCFTTIGDQGDTKFWNEYLKNKQFDIVIDDGSHQPHHQQTSLKSIWPKLKPGGIYVIEDLHCSYWHTDRWPWGFQNNANVFNTVIRSAVNALHYPFFKVKYDGPLYENMTQWFRAGKTATHEPITNFDETLESIHIYKSICFLLKKWD